MNTAKLIEEIKQLRSATVERLGTLPNPDEREFYLRGKWDALDEALSLQGRRDAFDEVLILLGQPVQGPKRFEGYQEDHEVPVKKGATITIRKGTTIRTTMPQDKDRVRVAGRTYTVTVDHILNGRNRPVGHKDHNPAYPVRSPSVRWPGTGGYWFEVDINDIPEAQP